MQSMLDCIISFIITEREKPCEINKIVNKGVNNILLDMEIAKFALFCLQN